MGLFADGFKELKKASEPLYKAPKSIQQTIEIDNTIEKGTDLYNLYNTNIHEKIQMQKMAEKGRKAVDNADAFADFSGYKRGAVQI